MNLQLFTFFKTKCPYWRNNWLKFVAHYKYISKQCKLKKKVFEQLKQNKKEKKTKMIGEKEPDAIKVDTCMQIFE